MAALGGLGELVQNRSEMQDARSQRALTKVHRSFEEHIGELREASAA